MLTVQMGMQMKIYWIVTIVWNYVLYLVLASIALILCACFQVTFMITLRYSSTCNIHIRRTIPVMLIFTVIWGFAIVSLTIFLAAILKSTVVALGMSPCLQIIS